MKNKRNGVIYFLSGVLLMTLWTGAAYAPVFLKPSTVTGAEMLHRPLEPVKIQILQTAPGQDPPADVSQSRLARRLNERYRVGRSIRASA